MSLKLEKLILLFKLEWMFHVHVQYRGVVTKGGRMKNFSSCTESVEAKNKKWMALGCYNLYYELVKHCYRAVNYYFNTLAAL